MDGPASDQDLSLAGAVELEQQLSDGRFARACGPDDGVELVLQELDGDILEDLPVRLGRIRERYVPQLNIADAMIFVSLFTHASLLCLLELLSDFDELVNLFRAFYGIPNGIEISH